MPTSMLVGFTGFVGSNIDSCHEFTWRINSKNVETAYGKEPDLLVYAGLRAEKFLANKEPEADYRRILEAMEQIKAIAPKRTVLISTVDVYPSPLDVNETSDISAEILQPYGKNRYLLENMVREYQKDALIVRLPGLFGKNIKKNFIYDYIHIIPSMLKIEKYQELAAQSDLIAHAYYDLGNGFYKYQGSNSTDDIDNINRMRLKQAFLNVGFSALNFTDSRSVFQYYPLSHLWKDIQIALSHNICLLNIATQPVQTDELYRYLSGQDFCNECSGVPAYYNYQSVYSEIFGGKNGYLMDKEEVKKQIKSFIESEVRDEDISI